MPQSAHYEKDKRLIPYLLACQPLVSFVGIKNESGVVFFCFSPEVKVRELINKFFIDQTPVISPKRLMEAIEEFRTILYREKDRYRMGYGGKNGSKNT